jgi:hypothetical protein
MMRDLAFAFVVESGDLEAKAVLLARSIRRFAGPLRESPIWVVQPRRGQPVSAGTLREFADCDVIHVVSDLNRIWADYAFANKIHTAAFVEDQVAGRVETLCFLDTDLVCVGPPADLLLRDGFDLALRPVDKFNVGSAVEVTIDPFWRWVYGLCGVDDANVWSVTTSVDRREVRAYFNAGLIATRPEKGLFGRWRDNLLKARDGVAAANLTDKQMFHLEAALFASTVLASVPRARIRLLDPRYNYPFYPPFAHAGLLDVDGRRLRLDDLVLVHYHRTFYDLDWAKQVEVGDTLERWLLERLPLGDRRGSRKSGILSWLRRPTRRRRRGARPS